MTKSVNILIYEFWTILLIRRMIQTHCQEPNFLKKNIGYHALLRHTMNIVSGRFQLKIAIDVLRLVDLPNYNDPIVFW